MSRATQPKQATRDPVRETPRKEPRLRQGEYRGRDGEVLRRRAGDGDVMEIPDDLKDADWSYQWNSISCFGQPNPQITLMMANGWRYVKPESRVGRYFAAPGDASDFIERGGLVLMERPAGMTEEAIEEVNERTAAQYGSLTDASSDLDVPNGFRSAGKKVSVERAIVPADLKPELNGIPDGD